MDSNAESDCANTSGIVQSQIPRAFFSRNAFHSSERQSNGRSAKLEAPDVETGDKKDTRSPYPNIFDVAAKKPNLSSVAVAEEESLFGYEVPFRQHAIIMNDVFESDDETVDSEEVRTLSATWVNPGFVTLTEKYIKINRMQLDKKSSDNPSDDNATLIDLTTDREVDLRQNNFASDIVPEIREFATIKGVDIGPRENASNGAASFNYQTADKAMDLGSRDFATRASHGYSTSENASNVALDYGPNDFASNISPGLSDSYGLRTFQAPELGPSDLPSYISHEIPDFTSDRAVRGGTSDSSSTIEEIGTNTFLDVATSIDSSNSSNSNGQQNERNCLILLWDSLWSDVGTILDILRHRAKMLIPLSAKIIASVFRMARNAAYVPVVAINLIRILKNHSYVRLIMRQIGLTSESAYLFFVDTVTFVLQSLLTVFDLVRRRVVPQTRVFVSKSYYHAVMFLVYVIRQCGGQMHIGQFLIMSGFNDVESIPRLPVHDDLTVQRNDISLSGISPDTIASYTSSIRRYMNLFRFGYMVPIPKFHVGSSTAAEIQSVGENETLSTEDYTDNTKMVNAPFGGRY